MLHFLYVLFLLKNTTFQSLILVLQVLQQLINILILREIVEQLGRSFLEGLLSLFLLLFRNVHFLLRELSRRFISILHSETSFKYSLYRCSDTLSLLTQTSPNLESHLRHHLPSHPIVPTVLLLQTNLLHCLFRLLHLRRSLPSEALRQPVVLHGRFLTHFTISAQ